MGYDLFTPDTPHPENFRKVTTDAYFTPDLLPGDAVASGDIRLGSITMAELKHGSSDIDVQYAYKGALRRGDKSVIAVNPEYEITLNEYTPRLVAMQLFGVEGVDISQVAATAQPYAIASSTKGRSYRVGKRLLSNVIVAVGGTNKVLNTDYTLDADKGIVTILDSGTIADASAVTVTYDCAAVTLKRNKPYTRLNRPGTMRIYEEDAISSNPRGESSFRCNLYPTEYGQSDPKKYSEHKFLCAVLGAMDNILRA